MTVLSMIGMGNIYAASVSENSTNTDDAIKHRDCAFGYKCDAASDRSSNLWISGDLLIWNVCEGGFSCQFGDTTINTNIVNSRPTTAITEHDKDIDFEWGVGVRVGMGMDFPCTGWDTAIYWTHFNADGDGHDHNNHAHWLMHFNVGDAILGRRFWIGSCVNLRPFTGVRYAQIKQKLRTRLETQIIATTGQSIVNTRLNDKQSFWGFGPELGLEADFYIGHRWSLYGSLAGAILYGHTNTKFNDTDSFALADNICEATSESCSNQMVLDVGVGIRYEFKYLTLQAGLEHHNYFDYNHIGCCGDLNLYGANVSAAVHF
jgi:hypothetical protein